MRIIEDFAAHFLALTRGLVVAQKRIPFSAFLRDDRIRLLAERRGLLAVGRFMLLALVLCADGSARDFDGAYEQKTWAEMAVRLPSFPVSANLIPFKVGAVDDKTFFIDGASISVGEDGVIRYSLVIDSASGARNISYEGLRCETAERRFYAFGRLDGTWSKAKRNEWIRIQGGTNNHHVELYSNYLCPVAGMQIRNAEDVRQALQRGGVHGITRD